ncbi:MAG TPA: dihydrouridine synthase [Marinilabiliales bacterium]|jgi:tRNA-dihydrouridine synthase|nr:MAG: hypothetical protein A2W95_18035 [Bacteroidetes bacterium GWA2_40_14]OFX57182.1 MAG: hypothetical protein A2W84_15165 [Bacteroidetes bacterium GWC2_40_13]OFX72284.1 MAG: hypothetical protein A2W96_17780 [Bacteroidetes bacterium GWD2_40_43]OFX90468.1 MAG: hypothetical protein A2W97_01620 [Bacteroidetes bacterium GWE2_40_63]OFY17286.1 MAG: hypothetical protein A2W88_15245 [Bacteroidetes bacterium GWF2_40_13]OFZ29117.1 MAG: hypothetical protein A2437_16210 [Bacteroidetes bacterium RIFOXYC
MILSCAPLQGYTESPFRNALHYYIGGIDRYYAPYIRFENDGSIKNKYLKDIHPSKNQGIPLIPQILVNQADNFLRLAKIIEDFGYTHVNWNLGCPYPMVAKRKLGSGLIPYPNEIQRILEEVRPKTSLKISIKIRAGYEHYQEVQAVLKACSSFPLDEVILHPRIGKQLYKGTANLDAFVQAQYVTHFNLAYNGDITDAKTFEEIQLTLPQTNHFMIGRGLLMNPFLASEIKSGSSLSPELKREKLRDSHEYLMEHFSKTLSGEAHVLHKMVSYWEYFSQVFENEKKVFKSLKKSHQLGEFRIAVERIFNEETLK